MAHCDNRPRLVDAEARLAMLADAVRAEAALLDFPERPWVCRHVGANGSQVLNVLVVGAGQAGLAILAALQREQVDGILGIDSAEVGLEGPWPTIARMHTLRTPKQLGGVDVGLPSLTFGRWFQANYGAEAWEALDPVPRLIWVDYLAWIRQVLALPVRNGVRLLRVTQQGAFLAAELESSGKFETLITRKVVFATGVDGGGAWQTPDVVRKLPKHCWAHTSENIDFSTLHGKRIGVLGAGASAMDAAATALEHGAQAVRQFSRRPKVESVQTLQWTGFPGFMRNIGDMDDQARWQFMSFILNRREPFTKDAWFRVKQFNNYRFVVGTSWHQLVLNEKQEVEITTNQGQEIADFVICGTGVDVSHRLRDELCSFHDDIAVWGDRFTPPVQEAGSRLLQFPYLTSGFAFTERRPGQAPQLANIHYFNFASTLSCGPSGAAIRGLRYAVPRLVQALSRDLFRDDLDYHWKKLRDYTGMEFSPFPTETDRLIENPDFVPSNFDEERSSY